MDARSSECQLREELGVICPVKEFPRLHETVELFPVYRINMQNENVLFDRETPPIVFGKSYISFGLAGSLSRSSQWKNEYYVNS